MGRRKVFKYMLNYITKSTKTYLYQNCCLDSCCDLLYRQIRMIGGASAREKNVLFRNLYSSPLLPTNHYPT
jgi:hypothetical protein